MIGYSIYIHAKCLYWLQCLKQVILHVVLRKMSHCLKGKFISHTKKREISYTPSKLADIQKQRPYWSVIIIGSLSLRFHSGGFGDISGYMLKQSVFFPVLSTCLMTAFTAIQILVEIISVQMQTTVQKLKVKFNWNLSDFSNLILFLLKCVKVITLLLWKSATLLLAHIKGSQPSSRLCQSAMITGCTAGFSIFPSLISVCMANTNQSL